MQTALKLIDKFNDQLGRGAAWLTLAMVLLVFATIVLRYGFQVGSIVLQEAAMYLNALIFTLGVGYTLKERGHVRVDVFYNRFSRKTRCWIDILGTVFLLMVTCGLLLWVSWDYVAVSWRIGEGSAESSGLPFVYLLKSCLLVLPLLLALQGLAELARSIQRLQELSESLPAGSGSAN